MDEDEIKARAERANRLLNLVGKQKDKTASTGDESEDAPKSSNPPSYRELTDAAAAAAAQAKANADNKKDQ